MSNHISIVKSIGAGVRKTEQAVPEILASVPDEYNWQARGAVPQAVMAWAVSDGAEAPAQKTGPKGNQTVTDFGRGVNTLSKAVSRALKSDEPKPVTLRATLSGEGGGSTVIPADHPLYAAIVALIGKSDETDETDENAAA